MWGAFVSLGHIALDMVFPRLCCGCDERIFERGRIVCRDCERTMRPLREPLCPRCGEEDSPAAAGARCRSCPTGPIYFEAARAATPYTGVAQIVVERLKYRARSEYADFLGTCLARALRRYYAEHVFDCIVPVPLHRTRRRERGYNQAELLAVRLGELTGIPVTANVLRRIRPTPSQTKLGRAERMKNVHDAFALVDAHPIAGRCLLLVDDVYTTGATLNECARVLRAAGAASVYGLCFCRATLDGGSAPSRNDT